MVRAMDTLKIGDFVQPNPDVMSTLSKYPQGTRFEVLALYRQPGHDPAGNVDLQLPDGRVEPLFPVSRLRPATGAREDLDPSHLKPSSPAPSRPTPVGASG